MKTDGTFTKLMMMTTSNNDQEALTALRKANAMMTAARINWEELLNEKAPEVDVKTDDINQMFSTAFSKPMSRSFRETMEGIYGWWLGHRFLTERQYETLRKASL